MRREPSPGTGLWLVGQGGAGSVGGGDGWGGREEEEHLRLGEVEGGLAALCVNPPWVPCPGLQSCLPFFPLSASLPLLVSAAAPGLS